MGRMERISEQKTLEGLKEPFTPIRTTQIIASSAFLAENWINF